jgi:hypothetical protein
MHRWEDNIKMGLQEVGCGGIDWIKLAEDRNMSLGDFVIIRTSQSVFAQT